MNYAIQIDVNGNERIVGKYLEAQNAFYREFDESTSTLQVSDALSFDERVYQHLKGKGVQDVVFAPKGKDCIYKASLKTFEDHGAVQDHGEGDQRYLSKKYWEVRPKPLWKIPWTDKIIVVDN